MAQKTELSLIALVGRKHLAFVAKAEFIGDQWYLIALEQHDAEFKTVTLTDIKGKHRSKMYFYSGF